MDAAMRQLRQAIKGIPVRREGFKGHHDRMAKAVAKLTVALSDSRSAIKD
ncbi:hypothetical protein [Amycolatopsis thermophila]|uniref:Transposase n=1 Tax=Amycolatopsis thermophila TaxID=206084 RepID=A0ABU0EZB3_9PSEU|nr:hypothetical protein [Amycolatopsis thermophila]MDQ0380286.1 hypothetical protein [Amycolatopsis thermophila]